MNDNIKDIVKAYKSATIKHGCFPIDLVRAGALVVEEAGELIKECNNIDEGNGDIRLVRAECIDTIVAAIRMLETLHK